MRKAHSSVASWTQNVGMIIVGNLQSMNSPNSLIFYKHLVIIKLILLIFDSMKTDRSNIWSAYQHQILHNFLCIYVVVLKYVNFDKHCTPQDDGRAAPFRNGRRTHFRSQEGASCGAKCYR